MIESLTELYDEKVLNDELPDAALEIAGSKWGDGAAASVTAAFCSGLDSCPSSPSKLLVYDEVGPGSSPAPL
jgi:hypothetical protein